ncbi:MAG TPA: hypothetical protein VE135_22060 [Pyrinomonadaceae bacterium]|nr:hypothetical protein [Pyrinomonadaceae bacterium]
MRLLTALLILSLVLGSNSTLPVDSAHAERLKARGTKPPCAEIKFHNLSRYKGQSWSRVFNDREIAPALRALLKGDLGKLKESLKEVTYPEDSLSYLDKNGVLTLEGGVPGLYTIMEAKLIIEPCGNLYAAILDNGERFLYFTNDRKQTDKLPSEIDQWRVKIEKNRNESRSVEALPVVIKNR